MPATIVPVRIEHLDSFRRCVDIVARERRYLAMLEAPPPDRWRTFLHAAIDNRYPYFVVADGEEVLGWCDITPFERESRRHAGGLGMGLLPEARGQAIGRRLIVTALEGARAIGLKRIELDVYDDNARAKRLYLSVGFEHEGVKRRATLIDGVYKDNVMMAIAELDQWTAPADRALRT